jgi:sugar phosphate isomerase/epimerase
MTTRPRLSVSTWSLHRALGITCPDSPAGGSGQPEPTYGPGTIRLLDVPGQIAAAGIRTLEICHFHLPRHDRAYLRELRAALDSAGVALFSLLIDDGDLTDPNHADRDRAWISQWLQVAAELGATHARVIAGKARPTPDTLNQSRHMLRGLAAQAQSDGLRLMTENWHNLLSHPKAVHEVLDALDGAVGLCLDFGNWSGATKYDDLAAIAALAESCHAKCSFSEPLLPNRADYIRCLDVTRAAGFSGPYTLIYDGPSADEWAGIRQEIEMVAPYLD